MRKGGRPVYVTSCNCEFGRDYDPRADPQGTVWRVVASDELPEGAETPPPEPSPSASPVATAPGSPAAVQSAPPTEASPPAAEGSPRPAASPAASGSPPAGSPLASPPSGASPPPSESSSPSASPLGGQEATVTMVDIAFEPSALTLPAKPGNTVSLPNEGAALHTFVIEELGISVEVPAGETGQATVAGPPGTYDFICDVPGHAEAGMVGTLTLE